MWIEHCTKWELRRRRASVRMAQFNFKLICQMGNSVTVYFIIAVERLKLRCYLAPFHCIKSNKFGAQHINKWTKRMVYCRCTSAHSAWTTLIETNAIKSCKRMNIGTHRQRKTLESEKRRQQTRRRVEVRWSWTRNRVNESKRESVTE